MTARIIVADDHQILREGLVTLLEKAGLTVVGQAGDGRTAVRLARELKPAVVIIDIAMPELNGIEATRQIVTEVPGVKVIALSMHADKHFVRGMLQAGASGYLLKHCASQELVQAIRAVLNNQIFLSPGITELVVEGFKSTPGDASVFSVLTSREREVLQLYAEGKISREIAATLHISLKTVEAYRRQIMEKMGFHSFADLIKYAIREGLTTLET
jgi:DNA-binding NarL/FixJ family response regulator|uniref:Response regulator transcription factor n=1 Tax=Desulfobacca acetoxidans TaxID=60893 RepID=A0A7C3UYG1_9BACT